jgi:hypothetical protein
MAVLLTQVKNPKFSVLTSPKIGSLTEKSGIRLFRCRDDVDRAIGPEFYLSLPEGKQGVVLAETDKKSRFETGASLADDDLAGQDSPSTENFHSQALGRGVSTILGTALSFNVCHVVTL